VPRDDTVGNVAPSRKARGLLVRPVPKEVRDASLSLGKTEWGVDALLLIGKTE
jgi:hypothetical protein